MQALRLSYMGDRERTRGTVGIAPIFSEKASSLEELHTSPEN